MIPQSRRACYKCGNVGHYAEVCSSNERLCYNCKQPGHESNNCPEEHTSAAKQCYNCQGMGHISSECPNPVVNGARCYGCGQTGHLARDCPTPNATRAPQAGRGGPSARGAFAPGNNFRGGFAGNNARGPTCYKCGLPNHLARDCLAQTPTVNPSIKCYACGKTGHISRDCPVAAASGAPSGVAGKTCYRCGEVGHISKDCSQAAPAGAPGVTSGSAGPAVIDAAAQPVGTPQVAPAA